MAPISFDFFSMSRKFSCCPRSMVMVTTLRSYLSWSQRIMTEVSRPPEYARTILSFIQIDVPLLIPQRFQSNIRESLINIASRLRNRCLLGNIKGRTDGPAHEID